MGLLDLPPEIIDTIIDLSLPLGIEGLVLTCKALHGRAKSQIQRHNALKRQWRCAGKYSMPERKDTVGILYEISLDPLVAQYIEVLDLWDRRATTDIEDDGGGYNYRLDKEAMERVTGIITGSAFYIHANLEGVPLWWKEMFHRETDGTLSIDYEQSWPAVVMLLGLLPNLRILRLCPWWEYAPFVHIYGTTEFHRGLAGMVRAANASSGRDKPLSKLEALLPFMPDGFDLKAGLQSVQPFMALNSLNEMYLVSAVAVDDGYTGIPFEWASPGLSSSLTRLEFASSCIDSDGLSNLIAHTPNLTIFKYSHETKFDGCQHDWNAGTFVEALARHCGNIILELALTIDELHGDIVNGASSFLSFTNLRKLEVDVQVFCGPPIESGQRRGEDAKVPEGERAWTKEDIPCIGSMMPNGVQEVQINTSFPDTDPTALQALLKNLKEQRAARLHALERVIIRQYGDDSVQEIAEWAGATLVAFDHNVERMRSRSKMPKWKREFEERVTSLASGSR